MSTNIQPPIKGAPLRAQWGVDITAAVNDSRVFSGKGLLVRHGFGGNGYAIPLPNMRETKQVSKIDHPFQVRRIIKPSKDQNAEPEIKYAIFLPEDSLRVNNQEIDIVSKLEIVEDTSQWYYIADEIKDECAIKLQIKKSDDGTISGKLETKNVAATDNQPGEDITDTLLNTTIAKISPLSITQSVMSAIVLDIPIVDDVSIGRNSENAALQISHFNDNEKDSGISLAAYLAPLLHADIETGEISAGEKTSDQGGEDSYSPMLLARYNGQIIYIPLSAGNSEEPPYPGDGSEEPPDSGDGSEEPPDSGDGDWTVDDCSITTNTEHGAVTSGIASIYGFADAPVGTVPIVANVNGQKVLCWGCTGNFGLTATKNGNGWTYTVSAGYYIRARTARYVSNSLTVSKSGGVYLKVPMDGGDVVIEHSPSAIPSSTSTITYIPLYWLNTTGFVTDYRGAPQIQMWE
jgi:hypothetical protein